MVSNRSSKHHQGDSFTLILQTWLVILRITSPSGITSVILKMRVFPTCATTSRVARLVFLAGLLIAAGADQPTITQMNLLPRQTKAGDIYGYLLNEGTCKSARSFLLALFFKLTSLRDVPVSCPSSASISFSGTYARCQLTSPEPPLPVMTDCRNSSVVVGPKTNLTWYATT